METFKETLRKIWYILYPFLFYYAVMLIIMTIAQWAFGGDATHYVFCQLIATVFTIPSMLPFYRQGQAIPSSFAPLTSNIVSPIRHISDFGI